MHFLIPNTPSSPAQSLFFVHIFYTLICICYCIPLFNSYNIHSKLIGIKIIVTLSITLEHISKAPLQNTRVSFSFLHY